MEFMAWNLLDPSYNQDVIEENALNEKFCVQVLRILIAEADTEINELEKDLVTFQSELAWDECEEWSEIWCSTLREKINYLDIALKSLRNTEKCEIGVHLLMHREPVERVHEIMKALLQNLSLKKDEQPTKAFVQGNDVHASRNAAHGEREQGSESRAGTVDLAGNGKATDIELKPSNTALALRASTKDGMEVCMTNKTDLISSLKTKGNTNNTQKVLESGISDGEHSGLTSTQEQQDQSKTDKLMPQFEGAPPLKAEIAANDSKSSLTFSMKPQTEKVKRKIQLNLPSVQEASALPTGVGSDAPISKVKKQRKLEKSNDSVYLNQPFDRKTLENPIHPSQQKGRELGVTGNVSTNSIVQTEKTTSVPILVEFKSSNLDMDASYSLGGGTERADKEETPCHVDGSIDKASTICDLNEMKLIDLKAIARHYKLQQYSKLKKDQLVKQLIDALRL